MGGGGGGGAVVSALDIRSEGRWCEAQSMSSCCFLRQETLLHIHLFPPRCIMGTGDILLGVTLRWTSIPSREE